MAQRFLLVLRHFEYFGHHDDDERDEDSAPNCREHDDDLAWEGSWLYVSVANCGQRDHNEVNVIEELSLPVEKHIRLRMQGVVNLEDSYDVRENKHRDDEERQDCLLRRVDEFALENESEAGIETIIVAELLGERVSVEALIE